MQNPRFQQQGFTLIEIAIVLVIIGLLLGGVLKGQELIESGKVKNAVNDFNGTTAAMNTYRDRYRLLPGDDNGGVAGFAARGSAWAGAPVGGADGVIGGVAADPFGAGVENIGFWRHLRASGLVTGNPAATTATALPQNAFGGRTGVTRGVYGIPGNAVLCMRNVPGKAAAALDTQFDDGVANTGTMRSAGLATVPTGVPAAAAPGAAGYNEDQFFTVCKAL